MAYSPFLMFSLLYAAYEILCSNQHKFQANALNMTYFPYFILSYASYNILWH